MPPGTTLPRPLIACLLALGCTGVCAQQEPPALNSADALVMATANPIAAMISLPLQSNWDQGVGPDNRVRYTLNVQPVIPFKLNDDWNLVTRTIVPVVRMPSHTLGPDASWNLSDTAMSLMLSPNSAGPVIWGAGPIVLLPTATEKRIGTEKWGLGPTGVVLVQDGRWTYGALANHLWSVAGNSSRQDVRSSYVNPFATYAFGGGWSTTMQAEVTYDHQATSGRRTTLVWTPIVARLVVIDRQPVSIALGYRHFSKTPHGSPDHGVRLTFNFLFPQ